MALLSTQESRGGAISRRSCACVCVRARSLSLSCTCSLALAITLACARDRSPACSLSLSLSLSPSLPPSPSPFSLSLSLLSLPLSLPLSRSFALLAPPSLRREIISRLSARDYHNAPNKSFLVSCLLSGLSPLQRPQLGPLAHGFYPGRPCWG